MAVIPVAGNQPRILQKPQPGLDPLTTNIVMKYLCDRPAPEAQSQVVVLFVFILIINPFFTRRSK